MDDKQKMAELQKKIDDLNRQIDALRRRVAVAEEQGMF
jgi:predicted  nucleic acid-binding Zn-ribbon protein